MNVNTTLNIFHGRATRYTPAYNKGALYSADAPVILPIKVKSKAASSKHNK